MHSPKENRLWVFFSIGLIIGLTWLPYDSSATDLSSSKVINLSGKLSELKVPSSNGAMAPRLTVAAGKLYLSWLEPDSTTKHEKKWHLKWSEWKADHWTTAGTIKSSTHFFINWADFPSLFATSSNTLYAHWLEKNPSSKTSYAYDVQLARSTDGGEHWQALGRIKKDLPAHEKNYDGFVSFVEEDGMARAFWIDGRDHDSKGLMSLRSVLIDDTIGEERLLDNDVCSCCGTAAVSGSQGSTIFYRNHTKDEIRDISYISGKGDQWSTPKILHPDNWHISGCPVNGPQAAIKDDHIATVSFSGADNDPSVRLGWSFDAGRTFGDPIEIDTLSPEDPIGRAGVVLPEADKAIVSWLGRDSGGPAALYLRLVKADGSAGNYLRVARLSANRTTGFPQLALLDDSLFIAWTEVSRSRKNILTKNLRLVKLKVTDITSESMLE